MSVLEWTQAELDAIRAAYVAGVKAITVGGVRKEFQSFQAMKDILAAANRQINGAPAVRYARTNKGL